MKKNWPKELKLKSQTDLKARNFFSQRDKMLKPFSVHKQAEMRKSPIKSGKLIQTSRKIDRISNAVN